MVALPIDQTYVDTTFAQLIEFRTIEHSAGF